MMKTANLKEHNLVLTAIAACSIFQVISGGLKWRKMIKYSAFLPFTNPKSGLNCALYGHR